MNKVKFFLAVSLFFLASLSLLNCVCAQETTVTNFPKIVYVEGSVLVNTTADIWVPAQKDMVLSQNNVVKTSDESYCDIAFDEKLQNIVSLGPNTELKISDQMNRISIAKGRVFSQLRGLAPGSTFEVQTPQAVAGARGTEWESIVDKSVKFNVNKSTIYVNGIGVDGNPTTQSDVPEGQSVAVNEAGWLGELVALTPEEKDRMANWSKRIGQALNLSERKRCMELVDAFDGASGQLFQQVLSCESGLDQNAFAAASPDVSQGMLGADDSQDQEGGITGDDITLNTFSEIIEPENPPLPETPTEPDEPDEPEPPFSCEDSLSGCPR